jgi:hypothetical protein
MFNQNHLNLGFVTETDTSYYSNISYDVSRLRREWKILFSRILKKKKENFPSMIKIIDDYINVIKKNCLNCEIRFLCMRCLANLTKDGKIELDTEFCKNNKESMNQMLEEIILLNEAGGFD